MLRNKCCRRRSIFAPSPRTLHVAYTVQDLQRYVIGNWCDVSKIGRINKRQTQMRKRRWKLKLHCRIDTAFRCMSGSPRYVGWFVIWTKIVFKLGIFRASDFSDYSPERASLHVCFRDHHVEDSRKYLEGCRLQSTQLVPRYIHAGGRSHSIRASRSRLSGHLAESFCG